MLKQIEEKAEKGHKSMNSNILKIAKRPYVRKEKQIIKLVEKPIKEKLDVVFNDSQVDDMVRFWEEKLALAMQNLNDKLPHFRTAEEMYLKEKSELDAIQTIVDNNKNMLESLARYRNMVKPKKEIRVLRTTSHVDKERKDRFPQYPWTQLGIDTLKKLDHFTDPMQLWDACLQHHAELLQPLLNDKKRLAKARLSTVMNWKKFALVQTKRNRISDFMDIYKGKIGLRIWLDEHKQPKGKYLRDFVFKS